jgi:hypothetical protein
MQLQSRLVGRLADFDDRRRVGDCDSLHNPTWNRRSGIGKRDSHGGNAVVFRRYPAGRPGQDGEVEMLGHVHDAQKIEFLSLFFLSV